MLLAYRLLVFRLLPYMLLAFRVLPYRLLNIYAFSKNPKCIMGVLSVPKYCGFAQLSIGFELEFAVK